MNIYSNGKYRFYYQSFGYIDRLQINLHLSLQLTNKENMSIRLLALDYPLIRQGLDKGRLVVAAHF